MWNTSIVLKQYSFFAHRGTYKVAAFGKAVRQPYLHLNQFTSRFKTWGVSHLTLRIPSKQIKYKYLRTSKASALVAVKGKCYSTASPCYVWYLTGFLSSFISLCWSWRVFRYLPLARATMGLSNTHSYCIELQPAITTGSQVFHSHIPAFLGSPETFLSWSIKTASSSPLTNYDQDLREWIPPVALVGRFHTALGQVLSLQEWQT